MRFALSAGRRSRRGRLRRTIWTAGLLALLRPQLVTPANAGRRRVVVVTQTAGFHHDSIPAAVALLRRIAHNRHYQMRFLASVDKLTPKRLARAGAIVFLNTSGELPMSDAQKSALLAFVHSGKGFVGTHSATDTLHGWADYARLLGGEFETHPYVGEGRVVVEDRRHPATRRVPASFLIREEFYVFRIDPRCCSHVLARLDVSSFGGDAADDRPLVWCRRVGKGRVFYDALGHFGETWSERTQQRLVAGGLAWALGLAGAGACR